MTQVPPTAIVRYLDGRWGFKNYYRGPNIIEQFSRGDIVFRVTQETGQLIEPDDLPFGLTGIQPGYYRPGGSHDLARAIYLEIPLVWVTYEVRNPNS